MVVQSRSEPEFTVASTDTDAQSARYAGAFFPRASGFAISGGVFTSNVTNNIFNSLPEQPPAAFRTILLGDIKLMKEIRPTGPSGVVGRQSRGVGVRRMYTAQIVGRGWPMTVAMYQGAGAEKEWREHIAKYESIRHPNIMQLYGLVNAGPLRAMVFHDELIPFHQFLEHFKYSSILTTYIHGYCSTEWNEAWQYLDSVLPTSQTECYWTVWIRPTTSELCLDLVPDAAKQIDDIPIFVKWLPPVKVLRLVSVSMDDPNVEAAIISSFTGDTYYKLSSEPPLAQLRIFSVSTQLPIRLGTIMVSSTNRYLQCGTLLEITEPICLGRERPMRYHCGRDQHKGQVLANSWIRFNSRQVRSLNLPVPVRRPIEGCKSWLSQANHIFTQLQTVSPFEDYVFVRGVQFTLRALPNMYNTHEPDGYLFVCSAENFRTEPGSFQWPDCPAYWSFDPYGAARLSNEDAKLHGFPVIHCETRVVGHSWDGSVYDGLRRFHRGRGFDPDRPEAAIHLGYQTYELSSEVAAPLACVQIEDGEDCDLEDGTALCQVLGHHL
ncbi:hypothetical protein B0H14DRAFT_2831995 [Mycena olivaceomarginata]|nr:hypothetical protein B0H14DRAFT_2831995 [Mycena olivaceomarginata]